MNDYVYPLLDTTTTTTTTTSADFPFLPPAVARFTYTDILTSSQRVSVRVIRCRRVAAAAAANVAVAKMPNLSTAYLLRAKF